MKFCTWVTGIEWDNDQKFWKVEMFKKDKELDPYTNKSDMVRAE